MLWPHAPDNWLFTPGLYFVTGRVLDKHPLLHTPERLSLVQDILFAVAEEFRWELRAWSVLINHYHFVAKSPDDPATLKPMLAKLHSCSARQLNAWDEAPGRKVWFRFMSTPLTFEKSLLARLHYTHFNPQRHGVVAAAETYAWCSAAWFAKNASPAFVKTVADMKSDLIEDDN